ncbi:DUF6541 family protein [Sciscionella sediminilitoris]|uniref:DUF6541 family protein n=1 Tax=Sciscionella sediminilitoris TaxID=1445613 RepID=UPI0004DF7018|nr:DUF6541 family protein [Sciscionella sp. SE31]
MPATDDLPLVVLTALLYIVALWLPGLAAGFAAGLRGWLLAATAPLISYAIAGLFGPLTTAIGIPWSVWTYLGSTVVVTAVLRGLYLLSSRRLPAPRSTAGWTRNETLFAIGAVAVAAVAGAAIVAGATGNLTHIPQDWDAVFHANSIRYLAETGDGSLTGMSKINYYEQGGAFYPNAYHLVAAVVFKLTGIPAGVVLNTQTVLLPGMLALVLVALLRWFGVRVLTAGFTALVAVSSLSALYDMLWRGPLLPFETASILSLAFLLLTTYFLDNRRLEAGVLFAIGAAALLAIQPSGLFTAILYAIPLLLTRWWGDLRRFGRELRALVLAGIVAIAVSIPFLLGSASSAADSTQIIWKSDFSASRAIGSLLSFQFLQDFPQIWLAIPLWIGLAFLRKLRGARWLLFSAAIFGALFVAATAYNNHLAITLTRPWWNDQWRLIALATIPLTVIAGHGLAQVCTGLITLGNRILPRLRGTQIIATGLVAVVFALLTSGFYYGLNTSIMAKQYGDGPAVDTGEYEALEKLGELAEPGEWVMNDRNDGSAWMYAVSGVRPVAGHYDKHHVGKDPALLMAKFDEYDTDPAVRAAAKRLRIKYVIVGDGHIRENLHRARGLDELSKVKELKLVFRNADAKIYRLG